MGTRGSKRVFQARSKMILLEEYMDNAIIVLDTLFVMAFFVHVINGNMIGRHDGVRANANCMIHLPSPLGRLFFLSRRRSYNVWSVSAQLVTMLCALIINVAYFLHADFVKAHFRGTLIIFVALHGVLLILLFIDVLAYDHRYKSRD